MYVLQVSVGSARPNPAGRPAMTGHHKQAVDGVHVADPGPRQAGRLSGVAGDFVGDCEHHGGSWKAVYAVGRGELDRWGQVLGRELPNGWMGENLTVCGIEAAASVVGTRWLVGTAELQVGLPRIPCRTFQEVAARPGWIKEFTLGGGAGTYLRVLRPGVIRPGDVVEVGAPPAHGVTVREVMWARTTAPELAPRALEAAAHLDAHTVESLRARLG